MNGIIVGKGRGDVETSRPMTSPAGAQVGRVVGNDQLLCRVNGVAGKV